MTTFLTLTEVARKLRYEDADGTLSPKGLHACRKWLASKGIRPSLKRGLIRVDRLDAVLDRIDAAQTRRRNRSFQSRASNFQQLNRACHSPHVSGEAVGDVHAASLEQGPTAREVNSIDRQVTR